jgi:IclR family KDG regulon transcriptional repressor
MAESTRTVERALDILLCFSRNEPVLTLTQIAERVELHKSTVHRLLATLENKRFVQRDEGNGSYRLGIRMIELCFSALKKSNLIEQALPYMHRLSAEHRETVDLAILEGADVVYLQVIESPLRMKIAAAPGEHLPAFCTATGKAFLAYLSEAEVKRIFKQGVQKYTEHTNLSFSALTEDLRVTRERGYAISAEEYEDSINSVAAPILDLHQHPIAAIAMVGPAFRLSSERMVELGQAVKETTNAIAQEIGLATQFSAKIPERMAV